MIFVLDVKNGPFSAKDLASLEPCIRKNTRILADNVGGPSWKNHLGSMEALIGKVKTTKMLVFVLNMKWKTTPTVFLGVFFSQEKDIGKKSLSSFGMKSLTFHTST